MRGTLRITRAAPDTTAGGTILCGPEPSRLMLELVNVGSVAVVLGASGVTTSIGRNLAVSSSPLYLATTSAVYGITASGTGDIAVTEILGQ
jgi:hypothetical protein